MKNRIGKIILEANKSFNTADFFWTKEFLKAWLCLNLALFILGITFGYLVFKLIN